MCTTLHLGLHSAGPGCCCFLLTSLHAVHYFSTSRATAYTTGADVRDYDITGLSAGDVYLVRIAAVNVNGTGEFTSWIEVTTFTVELDG